MPIDIFQEYNVKSVDDLHSQLRQMHTGDFKVGLVANYLKSPEWDVCKELTPAVFNLLPDTVVVRVEFPEGCTRTLTDVMLDKVIAAMNSAGVSVHKMKVLLHDVTSALGVQLDREPSVREISESALVGLARQDAEYILRTAAAPAPPEQALVFDGTSVKVPKCGNLLHFTAAWKEDGEPFKHILGTDVTFAKNGEVYTVGFQKALDRLEELSTLLEECDIAFPFPFLSPPPYRTR